MWHWCAVVVDDARFDVGDRPVYPVGSARLVGLGGNRDERFGHFVAFDRILIGEGSEVVVDGQG